MADDRGDRNTPDPASSDLVARLPTVPGRNQQGIVGPDEAALRRMQHERPSPIGKGRAGHGEDDPRGQAVPGRAGGVRKNHRDGESGRLGAGREGGVQVRSGSGRPGVSGNPCARTTRQEIAEAVTTRPVQHEPPFGPDKITIPLHARPTTLTAVEKSTRELFPQYLNFGFLLFS